MFPNTIVLTVGGVAKTLNRVNQDNYGSEYTYSGTNDALRLKIRHTTDSVDSDGIRMSRHNVYVEHMIYPTPTSDLVKSTFSVVIRGGDRQAPLHRENLAAAALAWVDSEGVLDNLVVGVN